MLVDTPNVCNFIMTSTECEAAATYLGLSDTSATPSPITSFDLTLDPPYCYIEGGSLQFNSDGANTGDCGGGSGQYHDECLCKIQSTTTTSTTTTTSSTTTTGEERVTRCC